MREMSNSPILNPFDGFINELCCQMGSMVLIKISSVRSVNFHFYIHMCLTLGAHWMKYMKDLKRIALEFQNKKACKQIKR